MGIEEPMAILKVGDWVLIKYDNRIGEIVVTSVTEGRHLVDLKDNTFARNLGEEYLTKIDPAFHKLLTDVYKESDDEKISNKPT